MTLDTEWNFDDFIAEHTTTPAPYYEPVNCGGCGRFVNVKDSRLMWDSEYGDYGTVLSRWVVGCAHCMKPEP